MAARRYSPETIIRKLREAELLQGPSKTIPQVVKNICTTDLSENT